MRKRRSKRTAALLSAALVASTVLQIGSPVMAAEKTAASSEYAAETTEAETQSAEWTSEAETAAQETTAEETKAPETSEAAETGEQGLEGTTAPESAEAETPADTNTSNSEEETQGTSVNAAEETAASTVQEKPEKESEAEKQSKKEWKFDFNITGSSTAEGWTGITVKDKQGNGNEDYLDTAEKGYGLITNQAVQGRTESVGNNEAYSYPSEVYTDFAILKDSEFVVDLPNGTYDVEVIVGSTNSNTTKVTVEDTYSDSINPGKSQYGVLVIPGVEVKDGQMNMSFGGDARVNGIVITDVTPVEMSFDFNITGSKNAEGWTAVTVNKKGGSSESDYYYTEEKGYGIIADAVIEGRSEAVGNNEEYSFPEEVYTDFAILKDSQFAVDLENGVYAVQFIVGSVNSNTTKVLIEDTYDGSINPGKDQSAGSFCECQ